MNVSDCDALGFTLPLEEVSFTTNRHVLALVSVCLSLLTVFTVFSNVIVIIALLQTIVNDRSKVTLSQSINGKITKILMTSMAVSDFFLGLLIMPMCVVEVVHDGMWVIGTNLCVIKYCLDYFLSAASTLHILALTLDRYLAVCHPLRYRILTNRHAYVILALTWLIPVGFLLSCFTIELEKLWFCVHIRQECNMYNSSPPFLVAFICSFIIPFIIVYILYACILWKLGQYKTALRKLKNRSERAPPIRHLQSDLARQDLELSLNQHKTLPGGLTLPNNKETSVTMFSISCRRDTCQIFAPVKQSDFTNSKDSAPARKTKTFRTIGVVMIGFTICWFPSWALALIFLIRRYTVPNWVMVCITWLAYLNSGISPVLYCCNRSVRKAVSKLLCPRRFT